MASIGNGNSNEMTRIGGTKMLQRCVITIVLALMLLLASCAGGGVNPTIQQPSPTENRRDISTTTQAPPLLIEVREPENPLRVVFNAATFTEEGFVYINTVLWSHGFNLKFEPFPTNSRLSVNDTMQYYQFLYNNIDENMVFMDVSRGHIQFYQPGGRATTHIFPVGFENNFGNFFDDAIQTAPNYMSHPQVHQLSQVNAQEVLTFIPTGFTMRYSSVPAVLVREDIAAVYGSEIRTGSQFVALLEWQKQRNPNSIPGVAHKQEWFNVPTGPYNGFLPYDLFLPEWGYRVYDPRFLLIHDLHVKVATPAYLLPESRTAIEMYAQLRYDQLLYTKINPRQGMAVNEMSYDEFPIVLTNTYAFLARPGLAAVDELLNFDASRYMMYTLYGHLEMPLDEQTFLGLPPTAVAGRNTDVDEFLRFLEWMTFRDNYELLFYGVEGRDYEILPNGRLSPLPSTDVNWDLVRNHLVFFLNTELEPIPKNAPINYEVELLRMQEWPALVLSSAERAQVWDDDEAYRYFAFTTAVSLTNQMQDLYEQLFLNRPSLPPERFMPIIDDMWDEYRKHAHVLGLYARDYTEVFETIR
jgi:hypothetical protein